MNRSIQLSVPTRLLGAVTWLPVLLALLIGVASPAIGQSATSKLYAKVQGEDLLVAIKVTPGLENWFYDDGPGDVGGKPTVVTLGGLGGVSWTPVLFPEPKVKYDESIDWTSKYFDKATVLYAAAVGVGADATAADVTAVIDGQVCDTMQCMPWGETLSFDSAGADEIWAGFPAALLVSDSGEAPTEAPTEATESETPEATSEAPVWTPLFAGDAKAESRAFVRALDDDRVELVIQVATPEHWHMYGGPTEAEKGPGIAVPTTITVEGGNVDWEDVHFPEPVKYTQTEGAADGWVWAYGGTFHFGVKGEAYDELDLDSIEISINGQSCDTGSCLPISMTPSVDGEGDAAMFTAAFADWTHPQTPDGIDVSSGSAGADGAAGNAPKVFGQDTESSSLLRFLILAIGAGLFTLLMPCTYPMIPITISVFTKQAEARGGKVLPLALAYGAGIVLMFVLLGVILGPLMVKIAAHWATNLLIGGVFVFFALSLFGMIDLRPPAFMMKFAGSANTKGGYTGVFFMGLTLVVTSFTCTGPFVGTLIAAGAAGGVMHVALGMATFGATMAAPFVLLALLPGRMSTMPSAGAWMNTLKVFMGFVELAASLKFFSNADISLHLMIIPREVFLILWTAIAFVAGSYLLGRVNLKGESPDGEIGPGRMMAALVTISGGFYCLLGAMGYHLDGTVMNAMAPPPTYSRGLVSTHQPVGGAAIQLPAGATREGAALVVVDDYDRAREIAQELGLGLILNFTAHT